jgi:hypothetical protein
MDEVGHLLGPQRFARVEKRARDRGDGNAVAHHDLAREQRSGEAQPEPVLRAALLGRDDLDVRLPEARDRPEEARAERAEPGASL